MKKFFEFGGSRLEPEYFTIENKMSFKNEKNELESIQRIIYNYNALKIWHKQEIKVQKKKIKETEKNLRKN